jgi:hypothetical protein
VASIVQIGLLALWGMHGPGDSGIEIEALSAAPYRVSGGNALVQISLPPTVEPQSILSVQLDGRDISGEFRPVGSGGVLLGS